MSLAVLKKIESLREFDPHRIILDFISDNKKHIAAYVSEMQLFVEGVRGEDGQFIADYWPYHPYTIAVKQSKGQPTDRVTLRDTGAFHRSIKVDVDNEKFTVTATDPKTDELMEKYGEGILNISDDNLHSLKQGLLLPELRRKFLEALS
jgi:hypothetical protein